MAGSTGHAGRGGGGPSPLDDARPAPFHQLPGDAAAPGQAFMVNAADGTRLRLVLWPGSAPASTVLLFPGRTEYAEKYAPVAQRLTAEGHAVLTIDWRGQGMSDRLLPDPRPGHVEGFGDYQADVAAMIAFASSLGLPRPWHLLAHSMGGCIGLGALMGGLPVNCAVFSAPMWGIGRAPWFHPLAAGLAGAACRVGRGASTAVSTGGGGTFVLDAPFRDNALTGDPLEWARLVAEAGSWPHLTLGGASYRWLGAALAECRRLAALPSPAVPALIGLGTLERVVSPGAIRARAARWPGARLMELADARHELMFAAPPAAGQFLDAALNWMQQAT